MVPALRECADAPGERERAERGGQSPASAFPAAVAAHRPGVQDRPGYRRREPESTVLYRILAEHLETFLERIQSGELRWPGFVTGELRSFLDCGVLARGFARVHCTQCGKDALVAFSCKGRGFCPSCGGRRMADTAAFLVDRVLPRVPVRQWVLTLPHRLRYLCAYEPEMCRSLRRIFVRAVFSHLKRRAREKGIPDGRPGAVVFVQRFDSALRLNLHFHALFLDGVFAPRSGRMVFHALQPGDEDIARLTRQIHDRVLRFLRRRGKLDEEGEGGTESDDGLATCYAASVQGRVAFGEAAGWHVQRLVDPGQATDIYRPGKLCAQHGGFTLHGKVKVAACARERLEKLCRYVARPPIAQERLSVIGDGRVLYRLKRPYRDGSTHVLFEPMVFLERLAALVPRPRVHLVTYHGVLAPASPARALVVPEVGEVRAARREAHGCGTASEDEAKVDDGEAERRFRPPRYYRWADLIKRVFEVDVLVCEHCGGPRRVLTFLTDPPVLRAILEHLGLPADPPPLAPARAPPDPELPFGC